MRKGKSLIFSAPSGSGKTTIVQHLVKVRQDLKFSISATTRPPRGREQEGVDYYYISEEDFRERIAKGELLEWEEVYPGLFYGTPQSEVDRIHQAGFHAVFDVDVVGGANLKRAFGSDALGLFVRVKDLDQLRSRLSERGTESAESIKMRLDKAEGELAYESQFDHTIVNDDLTTALAYAEDLVSRYLDD